MIASTSRMRKKDSVVCIAHFLPQSDSGRLSSVPLYIPPPNDRGASLGPVASSDVRVSIGRQGWDDWGSFRESAPRPKRLLFRVGNCLRREERAGTR